MTKDIIPKNFTDIYIVDLFGVTIVRINKMAIVY